MVALFDVEYAHAEHASKVNDDGSRWMSIRSFSSGVAPTVHLVGGVNRRYGMSRRNTEELATAFRQLVETAETFVNRAPKQKRLDAERSALLDAISHAQLVLSVYRISNKAAESASSRGQPEKNTALLERRLQELQDKSKKLEHLLEAETNERKTLQQKVKKAKDLLESASAPPTPVIPFTRRLY